MSNHDSLGCKQDAGSEQKKACNCSDEVIMKLEFSTSTKKVKENKNAMLLTTSLLVSIYKIMPLHSYEQPALGVSLFSVSCNMRYWTQAYFLFGHIQPQRVIF